MIKRIFIGIVCFQLVLAPSLASDLTGGFIKADEALGAKGNIFVSGQTEGAVLMKVNLWGSVVKSGIHYVPPRTDFVTLLSYAGGPFGDADLENVYIKRQAQDKEEIININIKDIIGKTGAHNPLIEPNDIIIVPAMEPTVSDNTFKTITLVSTILSIVLAGAVLQETLTDD